MEETQLIDLKNEDNRTAEVTIIDDDEPGVIAFRAPKEGSPAKALPPVTCSEKAGHAKIRVGVLMVPMEKSTSTASLLIKLQ